MPAPSVGLRWSRCTACTCVSIRQYDVQSPFELVGHVYATRVDERNAILVVYDDSASSDCRGRLRSSIAPGAVRSRPAWHPAERAGRPFVAAELVRCGHRLARPRRRRDERVSASDQTPGLRVRDPSWSDPGSDPGSDAAGPRDAIGNDEGGLSTSFVSSPYRRNRCRRPLRILCQLRTRSLAPSRASRRTCRRRSPCSCSSRTWS